MNPGDIVLSLAAAVVVGASFSEVVWSQLATFAAHDPGVRSGSASAGAMLQGHKELEKRVFGVELEAFEEVASVQGGLPDSEASLGKRIFFLHDGRTKDLLEAIQAHAGFGGGQQYAPSEANQVVGQFNRLNEIDKQHMLNFLRAL